MRISHVYVIKEGIVKGSSENEIDVSVFHDYLEARKNLLMLVRKRNNKNVYHLKINTDDAYQELHPDYFVSKNRYYKITAYALN